MKTNLLDLISSFNLLGGAISMQGRRSYALATVGASAGHCDCEGNCSVPSGDHCPGPGDGDGFSSGLMASQGHYDCDCLRDTFAYCGYNCSCPSPTPN